MDLRTGAVLPTLLYRSKASKAESSGHQHGLEGGAHAAQLEDSREDTEEQLPEKPMSRRAAREIEALMDSMQETAPSRQRRQPAKLTPALPAVPRYCPPSRTALSDKSSDYGQHALDSPKQAAPPAACALAPYRACCALL